jgi:hypothetical protein
MGRSYLRFTGSSVALTAPAKTKVQRMVSTISGRILSFFWHAQGIHVLEETQPVYISYLLNCITSYLEHIL